VILGDIESKNKVRGGKGDSRTLSEKWRAYHPISPSHLKTPALFRNRMNHTICPLCSMDVSRQCLGKHFFSAKHVDEFVIPALKKEKAAHRVWRASTTKSANPIIYYGQDEKGLHICFGCKAAKQYLPSHHLSECKHATEHIDTLKKLLGDETQEEAEAAVYVSTLKKEIETLKKRITVLTQDSEQVEEQRDELHQFIRDYFKMDYDDIYEDMKRDLIEEGYRGNIL